MSRRNIISTTSPNEQEHSSGSFHMPDSSITASSTAANTMMMHARFAPISSNPIPTLFNTLNNSLPPNNGNNIDSRNFLFPTDRFNPPLLQPNNISPYASIINNNDPRFHSAPAIFPNPLRQYNSIGIGTNVAAAAATFDRFLQSFPPLSQGTTAINSSSVPVISVTPTIPTATHTSLFPMVTSNNNTEPSTSSGIPSSSIPLVNDQPYRYLLSFEQQAKIAHEAAMHYANLTEHLMEHARNAAAAENMPLPPLPQAVFSMVQKYDQQKEKESPLQLQQKQKEEEKMNQNQQPPTCPTLCNMAIPSFSFSDAAIIDSNTSDQHQQPYTQHSGLLGQKRTSLGATFSEPMIKAPRHAENLSNTDTTPSRSESNSSNKTAAEILPILSPHPYCPAATENNFEQQQNEVEVDESGRKNVTQIMVAISSTTTAMLSQRHYKNSNLKII